MPVGGIVNSKKKFRIEKGVGEGKDPSKFSNIQGELILTLM